MKSFDDKAIETLTQYSWPGNVRELKNIVERLVIMTPDVVIKKSDLPPDMLGVEKTNQDFNKLNTLKEAKNAFEKSFISTKLAENDGNITRTAEVIGLERSNLHKTY